MYYIQYSLIGQVIQMLMTRHFIMTETKSIINDKNSIMNKSMLSGEEPRIGKALTN